MLELLNYSVFAETEKYTCFVWGSGQSKASNFSVASKVILAFRIAVSVGGLNVSNTVA